MKLFLSVLIILLSLFVAFYFWASSSSLSTGEFAKVREFDSFELPASDSIFTVITFNIGYLSGMANNESVRPTQEFYEKNMTEALIGLSRYSPDILALQEIDFNSSRSYFVDQTEAVAHGLKMRYASEAVNWDKRYVPFPYFPPSVHFGRMLSGQAVLSRFPISKTKRHVLQRVASHPFYYNAFYLDRLAQVTELDITGQKLVVINVHLEAFDKPTRELQGQKVMEIFKHHAQDHPTLLVGDFNSVPRHKEDLKPVSSLFIDDPEIGLAFNPSLFHMEGSFTYPSGDPKEQLDYIFYNKSKIELLEWHIIKETGESSDHFPVMMKFKLKSE